MEKVPATVTKTTRIHNTTEESENEIEEEMDEIVKKNEEDLD